MPLAGIKLVRQVFGEQLPEGWSVAQAYLNYKHDHDVEWQVLTFRVIDPNGKAHEVTSDKVPARDDVNDLTIITAKKFLEGFKHEPSPGSDAKNGG